MNGSCQTTNTNIVRPKDGAQCQREKIYVLDASVLLHDPASLYAFDEHTVALPMSVIEELDHFKTSTGELANNARTVFRNLDELRELGSLSSGVKMVNGGTCRLIGDLSAELSTDAPCSKPRELIRLAAALTDQHPSSRVIVVSKDMSVRLKCDALGIDVQDYLNSKVNPEDLYSGMTKIQVRRDRFDELTDLVAEEDGPFVCEEAAELLPNEFLIVERLKDGDSIASRPIVLRALGKCKVILVEQSQQAWSITGRNLQQNLAIDLLMDPKVSVVTLVGKAGTGKTLLALAAALETTLIQSEFKQVLVTRPIMPLGKDIGYMPGGKSDKLAHWMQPIFDNLSLLTEEAETRHQENRFHALAALESTQAVTPNRPRKGSTKRRNRRRNQDVELSRMPVGSPPPPETPSRSGDTFRHENNHSPFALIGAPGDDSPTGSSCEAGDRSDVIRSYSYDRAKAHVQMEAVTFIRGRTITSEFVIVDECQNLTPLEVKTVISRAGENTKVVLTGDPMQIDNPYLDATSNGLTHAAERMKSSPLHGHLTLKATERSALARLAADCL